MSGNPSWRCSRTSLVSPVYKAEFWLKFSKSTAVSNLQQPFSPYLLDYTSQYTSDLRKRYAEKRPALAAAQVQQNRLPGQYYRIYGTVPIIGTF